MWRFFDINSSALPIILGPRSNIETLLPKVLKIEANSQEIKPPHINPIDSGRVSNPQTFLGVKNSISSTPLIGGIKFLAHVATRLHLAEKVSPSI